MTNRTRQDIVILGARSQAPVVADWMSDLPNLNITHLVENMEKSRADKRHAGYPVLWIDDLPALCATHKAICVLGSPKRQLFIEQVERMGFEFVSALHPGAEVSRQSEVGTGSIVSPGVVIAAFTKVAQHVFLNRGVLIGHDSSIGRYSTIGPGANIAGFTRIGEGVHVGMGAKILDKVSVGDGAIVGAGSVVTKDVPAFKKVMGMPARSVAG